MDLPRLHCKGVVGAAGFLEAIILCFMNNERIIEQNSVLFNWPAPLIRTGSPTSFNVSDLAKKAGVDDVTVIQYLREFLVTRDRKEVLKKMTNECNHLELQVERLFTGMVPHYARIRSFYLQSPIPR